MITYPVSSTTSVFQGRRISLRSAAPFEEVVTSFEASFPPIDPAEIDQIVAQKDPDTLRIFFERKAPGSSFNAFHMLDQGSAMTLLGTQLKSHYYLVGNALIAQEMFARESAAGLCAPVRVVVTETADGGTQIDYDEPSSIFSQFPTLADSPIPPMLDLKLRELFMDALTYSRPGKLDS